MRQQVMQNKSLLDMAILAKSVMQVNLRKEFTEQEWDLIMQDSVCDTAMDKVITEAKRFMHEPSFIGACVVMSAPYSYSDMAKYLVALAAGTILKEYKSNTILPDEELADIINKL